MKRIKRNDLQIDVRKEIFQFNLGRDVGSALTNILLEQVAFLFPITNRLRRHLIEAWWW